VVRPGAVRLGKARRGEVNSFVRFSGMARLGAVGSGGARQGEELVNKNKLCDKLE
jgi:hypothetical protein